VIGITAGKTREGFVRFAQDLSEDEFKLTDIVQRRIISAGKGRSVGDLSDLPGLRAFFLPAGEKDLRILFLADEIQGREGSVLQIHF